MDKKRNKIVDKPPYRYRNKEGCADISHEFFQLYRYTENQDKWLLTILDLFDDSTENNEIDYIRLCNFTRVIEQINVYGSTQNLFTYKFLEHLFNYYRKALLVSKSNVSAYERKTLRKLALYANDKFFRFMISTYTKDQDSLYLSTMNRTIKSILDCRIDTVLLPEDHLVSLLDHVIIEEDEQLQTLFVEMLEHYYKCKNHENIPDNLQKDELQKYIHIKRRSEVSDVEKTKGFLFSENNLYGA